MYEHPTQRGSERHLEPHGAVWEETSDRRQAARCPICCDSQLDENEVVDPFCACGYQLCSFCLNRIKTESDNTCPHCRTSYEHAPQEELRTRLAVLAVNRQHQQQEERRSASTASPRSTHAPSPPGRPPPSRVHQVSANGHTVLEIPRRGGPKQGPPSPGVNLRIDQEQLWPPPAPPPRAELPTTHLAPSGPDSRPSTSVGTASGTPPSPVSSVMVQYYGATPSAQGLDSLAVQGECIVMLRPHGGVPGVDAQGSALARSLQEAVQSGRMSAHDAAAAIVRHLRAAPGAGTAPPPGFERQQQTQQSMQPQVQAVPGVQWGLQGAVGGMTRGAGLFDGWDLVQGASTAVPGMQQGLGTAQGVYHPMQRAPPPGFASALADQEMQRSVFLRSGMQQ